MPEADTPSPGAGPTPAGAPSTAPAAALARLRAAFPVAERWIYFDHAAVCPLARPVREAVETLLDDVQSQGGAHFEVWLDRREQARVRAARLLGAQPDEIAFVTSTSEGLIHVAEGLNWGPGDEIVVIEDDFPANHVPWFHQERHGARVVVVPRDEGRVGVEAILACVTERTRVVAVPTVLYDCGFRLDIETLGQALADHPALLCVDAIQSLGAFPVDVRAAHIDFLAADSHKWMLGLEGIGLFYCRAELLDRLDSPIKSWLSMAVPFAPYRREAALAPSARRFEYACRPTAGLYGLDACLELLLATGAATLVDQVLALTDRLAAGLRDAGWVLSSPRDTAAESSGIVRASAPGLSADAVRDTLAKRGVCVSERAGAVRFSPHAWNTADEVDALLQRLPELP